jgi:D-3-phosphoglycerate dehydrogenase
MHDMKIPASVVAVGRAGAGVNNIPVEALSKRGIPVFNAPGANANAVKELAVAGMLIAARNICSARDYVRDLDIATVDLAKAVEEGKKKFVGFELPGRILGVIGLGAIGVEVANVALSLGMRVIGFDPQITVRRAWQLSSGVQQVESLDELFRKADFVTAHVPLVDATLGMIGAQQLMQMRDGGVLINFARGGVVDRKAVLDALECGKLHQYVCDFPEPDLIAHEKVVLLPHLGASTAEAEENCAIMVADNLKEYLQNGNVRFSVNFPQAMMPRNGEYRITIANANVPNMVGQISTCLAVAGLNIEDLLNKSQGELAYTLVDLDGPVPDETIAALRNIKGVLTLRNLGKAISSAK